MKKQLKKAKILFNYYWLVAIVLVTFFIVTGAVFAAWIGPTAEPPDENRPGYIWNVKDTGFSGQPAEIDITAKAKVGALEVIADYNQATVGGKSICVSDGAGGSVNCGEEDLWTLAANGLDIYYNDGNVGIGTTNPQEKFHVARDGYPNGYGPTVMFDGQYSIDWHSAFIWDGDEDSIWAGRVPVDKWPPVIPENSFIFGIDNTASSNAYNTVILGGSGNIIESGANSSALIGAGGSRIGTNANYAAVIGGGGNAARGDYSIVLGGESNSADGNYSLAAGHYAFAAAEGTFALSGNYPLTQLVVDKPNVFGARFVEYWLLGGNIGIGTRMPEQLLALEKTDPYDVDNAEISLKSTEAGNHWGIYHDRSSDDLRFWHDDNQVTFTDDGKVGIGTANPISGYKLDVRGNIINSGSSFELTQLASGNRYSYIDFHGDDTYTDYGLRVIRMNTGSNAESRIQHRGSGILKLYTQDAGSHIILQPAGNVGIGTTNPGNYKLKVAGSISATAYYIGDIPMPDYVFAPDYPLESIEEHSQYMWANQHLEAIPVATLDENGQSIVNLGAQVSGLLEELEKAHIYIEQLNNRINQLEEKVEVLEIK